MSSKIFRAVILGAPASGKGTISKRIVEKYGFVHISPGDILRVNILNGTSMGKKAKKYIEEGKLVPDDIVIKCVLGRIIEAGNRSWMLDGFPRTIEQARQLHASDPVEAVINLNVPDDVIVDRASGRWVHMPSGRVYNVGFNAPKIPGRDDVTGEELVQRPDDKPEIVRKRLQVYKEQIKPIIDFYQQHGLITDFAGTTTAEIWPRVDAFLEERTKAALARSL